MLLIIIPNKDLYNNFFFILVNTSIRFYRKISIKKLNPLDNSIFIQSFLNNQAFKSLNTDSSIKFADCLPLIFTSLSL